MAGTIIADFIRTDANQLSLNVGNTTFATINASGFFSNTGTQLIAANGSLGVSSVGANQLQSGSVTNAKISTAANTIPRSSMTTGAVLQVVATNDSVQRSVNSGTYTASGMLVTITPTSATSKILVQFSSNIYKNTDGTGYISIFRNGTNIAGSGNQFNLTSIFDKYVPCSILFLDSPASTSALTYEVYFARTGSANIYINATNSGVTMGSITVTEIAA
jgi:hypothetical protein